MSQVSNMFRESNARMRKIMNGDFDHKQITSAQREFEGQIKLLNSIISIYGVASKNKRALSGFQRMNVMDDTAAVDLLIGRADDEKVRCPLREDLISREECLDFSGSNPDACRGCKAGSVTKQLLLDGQVSDGDNAA